MEPLPLIPKTSSKTSHDTSHILREAFQDLLSEQIFPENVSKNMEKYNLRMTALRENAMHTNIVRKKIADNLEEITLVEHQLMDRQAKYLIAIDSIVNDRPTFEKSQLKSLRCSEPLSPTYINKYGLLDSDNLLPSLPERAMDFRINSNRHMCEYKCEGEAEVDSSKLSRQQPSSQPIRDHIKDTVLFEATPKTIVFNNYELNVTYVKRIKLRNITNTTRSIVLKQLPKIKSFSLELESSSRVAAGMCAVYTVKYKTEIYQDIKADVVTFDTYGGRDVTVTLRSRRLSPCLRIFIFRTKNVVSNGLKLDSLSDEFFNIDRTMALNTSIDCGSTLVGDEIVLSVIVKNEGGFGEFFFITETDWFSNNVEHINNNIELLAGAFRLYPAYFKIMENEFAEVILSFYPKRYGLFVETVYMLCNNNTYEELDFIGDGMYFEKSYISFDLKKKDCQPFFLDEESEYCLHLGKCLACDTHTGFISVSNRSPLNLCHRWTLRRSENPKSKDFKHMAPHWITIRRMTSLPAHSTTDFDIFLCPETTSSGLYRIVLSLYIENIPQVSLRDLQEFSALEKADGDEEGKLLDILMGEIELLCEVEKIDVILEPNPLIIPVQLSPHIDYKHIVTIISGTHFPLECEWVSISDNKRVRIEPEKFQLFDSIHCVVQIDNIDIDNIEEEFLLYVNEGLHKIPFKVEAKISIPRGAMSIAAIDFGHVMERFVYNKQFRIENTSKDPIRWRIVEDIVVLHEDCVITIEETENLVPNRGMLYDGENCTVTYTANTQDCGEWLSYLKLYTNFTENDKADFVCGVHFIVSKPEILIHTNTSELPILCPDDVLYVGVPIICQICVHNSGNIVSIFVCGKLTGTSASQFDVAVTPSVGIVNVGENFRIDVKITPKAMGYFEDVYFPIFTLGCEKVTLVKLMCLVTDITVTIYLPDDQGDYIPILWPRIIPESEPEVYTDEFRQIAYEDYPEAIHEKETTISEESPVGNVSLKDSNISDYTTKEVVEIKGPSSVELHIEEESGGGEGGIKTLYRRVNVEGASENMLKSTEISEDSLPQDVEGSRTATAESSRMTSSSDYRSEGILSLRSIFENTFGPDLCLQDYYIEFKSVPLRTPVQKTIKVVNMTPGTGSLQVEITHFYHSERSTNSLIELLAKMKMAKSRAWDDLIADNGIVIKIEQSKNNIGAYEEIQIDIWVYADTWGYYGDEIIIDISQLTPFCASVLVEVVGLPIEFPIAQNSIRNEPIMRFGAITYRLDNVRRKLKVANTSAIPVSVSWYLFVNPGETKKAFSLIFDMPDSELFQFSEELVKGELLLTNRYYGEPNAIYFDIEPLTSYIEPKSFAYVDIIVNTSKIDDDLLDKQLEASLLGVIRVPTQHRYYPNIVLRPTAGSIPLSQVRITFKVQSPKIVIDESVLTIQLNAFATDIMESETITRKKTVVFRNVNACPTLIYIETEKPFKIIGVRTPKFFVSQLTNCIELLPNESMKVTVSGTLTGDDILKMIESLRTSHDKVETIPNFTDNSITITKMLNIYQGGYIQKIIPLEMRIYYPLLKATPGSITFNNVYIGDTARMIVTLRNLTGPALKYEIYKCNKTKEIVADPVSGIIPNIGSGGTCTLGVYFTPIEPTYYEEWIAVTTTVMHHYVIVNVCGTGTYDEKFHVPGVH